jgi:CBS domain-containing protein
MSLQAILQHKGTRVFAISPDASLGEVVQKLVKYNCGSLVVCEGEDCTRMVGIISERDILRAWATRQSSLDPLRVSEIMTREVTTCAPNDSVQDAMGMMTERRIRHLPIVDDRGDLVGIVSIGDLVKHQHDQLTMENHYLKTYIQS